MSKHPVQPPEWIDAAPIRNVRSVEVDAPVELVWARIAEHETWPQWFTALDSVEVLGTGEGIGGGRRVIVNRLPLDEEFTAWDEHEHFAFAVVGTKLPILQALAESVRLEPTDAGGCRVTYAQGLQAKRGFGLVLEAGAKRMDGELGKALDALKAIVESDA